MSKDPKIPAKPAQPNDNVQHPGPRVRNRRRASAKKTGNNVQHPGNDVQHPGGRVKRRHYQPEDNVQHPGPKVSSKKTKRATKKPGNDVQHPGGRLRWLKGLTHPVNYQPKYWSAAEVENLVGRAFPGRWTRFQEYYREPILGDAEYYLPTHAEVKTIIANSLKSRRVYAPNIYDCEDFAFVLKSHFCQAAYCRGGELGTAYCMGIVWGEGLWTGQKGEPHAMNWVITAEGYLWLIEPQTGEMRSMQPAAKADNGVYLLLG
jgi:hypothetical protein